MKKTKFFDPNWKKTNKVYKDDYKRSLICCKIMWVMKHRFDSVLQTWVKNNLVFLNKVEKSEFENQFEFQSKEKNKKKTLIDMRISGGIWFEKLVAEHFRQKYHFYEFPEKNNRLNSVETKKILSNKKWNVFWHPSFLVDDYVTEVDFLKRNGNGFDLYEVKSLVNIATTKAKLNLTADLAYQNWILKKAGYEIKNVYLIYLNRDYHFKKKLDIEKLMKITDEFNRVELKTKNLSGQLTNVKNWLNQPIEEVSKWLLNSACNEQKTHYCTHLVPWVPGDHLWTELYRLTRLNKAKIIFENGQNLAQLNLLNFNLDNFSFSKNQKRQIKVIQGSESNIKNKKIVQRLLQQYKFPIYFYDFETTQMQIPKFDGMTPYNQIPFQYSIFVLTKKNYDLETNKNVKNFSFIIENQQDPRKKFINNFLKDIQSFGKGSYVAYSTSFEKSILKNIPVSLLTNEERRIKQLIIDQSLDLMDFFKGFNIYLKNFFGSLSIKKTLPAFAPKFNYENLVIQKGYDASNFYFQYVYEQTNDNEWKKISKELIKYCNLDARGMAVLYHSIKKMLDQKNN